MNRSVPSNLVLLAGSLSLAGCGGGHSPTVDILGSYFPAWIICIIMGLLLTALSRQFFIGLRVVPYLRPAPLIYLCLMVCFTLAVWLCFFKN